MILVTGATGHLGNVLVRKLLARGERVRALVLPNDYCVSLVGLDVERVSGNVLVPSTLERALIGVQTVYHLAGIISILPGAAGLMQRVNVEGVRNVAQAALQAGVERMVHVSSVHAFHRPAQSRLVDETEPLALEGAAGAYDHTKAAGTQSLLEVVAEGLDAVVVCPTGIIGPRDYLHSEMGQTILEYTRNRLHVLVTGAYDFVDVRDVVQGVLAAGAQGHAGELYILSGTHIALPKLHDLVQELAGIHSPKLVLPFGLASAGARLAEVFYQLTQITPRFTSYALRTVHDNALFSRAKAERELGYHPRSLRETLLDTIAWQGARA
ncbi:MAG: NAD-dependent epimerase/dehydratase family protein [Chloroflexota bacterium]|nr:NAD-dependent epimerase/dehydratase family protein [Chloroflexota bacterium]